MVGVSVMFFSFGAAVSHTCNLIGGQRATLLPVSNLYFLLVCDAAVFPACRKGPQRGCLPNHTLLYIMGTYGGGKG